MADTIQMPSSGGGLTRFSDELPSKFEIPPLAVIIMIAVIIVVELVIYKMSV